MPPTPGFTALTHACREAPPAVAVVLGSGMGAVARRVRGEVTVPFADVPGLPPSSVAGHKGCLTLGEWAGLRVLVFEGRLHHYEGHGWDEVVRPVRLAAELGARKAILTNASGGIREDLVPGSLMAVRDHIQWTRPYWWRHPGPGGLGPARPSPYSAALLDVLTRAAGALGERLPQGVYAAVTGPSYETPAEVRALRAWGADAVGMSTAREVEAGADAGLECAALSCITNRAAGLATRPLSHAEVLEAGRRQGERVGELLERALTLLRAEDG
jgi:purine-nucleoside phosphorylase